MALALIFGLVLWPIGRIGTFFAMLVNAAVNRQREFLADATAVQFTRDPSGLCEALEILREDEIGGRLRGTAALLAGHMFFTGVGAWQRLFETHPPLDERIRRLLPQWEEASCQRTHLSGTDKRTSDFCAATITGEALDTHDLATSHAT
jgi:Zn-dependent protease with chaperone function